MTRTYIISADGERFESISAKHRLIRRMIAALVITLTAIFLSAAIIGLNQAIHHPAPTASPTMAHTAYARKHHRYPNREELQELALAKRANPKGKCHLEWDGPAYPAYEAICN